MVIDRRATYIMSANLDPRSRANFSPGFEARPAPWDIAGPFRPRGSYPAGRAVTVSCGG
jgi:hypothetical protein